MPTEKPSPSRILIVDDNEGIRVALSLALTRNGYTVLTAANGEEGQALAVEKLPDVILLDILMPRRNGLQVCEHLQQDDRTSSIPIIFLTGCSSGPDRIRGLECGAVDYVTKPFDFDEVLSRVRAALRTTSRARTRRDELDQLKQEFIRVLSHEMATPLTAIRGFTELLESGLGELDVPSQVECLREIGRSSRRLSGTLDDLLALNQIESSQNRAMTDLIEVIRSEVDDLAPERAVRGQKITLDFPPNRVPVLSHPRFLPRAVHALVSNAQKFSDSDAEIEVHVTHDASTVSMIVIDHGPGLASVDHERIFDKFLQLDPSNTRRHPGMGIGLAVARRVVRAHGGDVTVTSAPGRGCSFTLTLPIAH